MFWCQHFEISINSYILQKNMLGWWAVPKYWGNLRSKLTKKKKVSWHRREKCKYTNTNWQFLLSIIVRSLTPFSDVCWQLLNLTLSSLDALYLGMLIGNIGCSFLLKLGNSSHTSPGPYPGSVSPVPPTNDDKSPARLFPCPLKTFHPNLGGLPC